MSAAVAIITGAGSGMGAGAAHRLSRDGINIVAVDIDGAAAERTVAALPGPGVAVAADIASEQAVDSYTRVALETFGRIDHAFLNAGIGSPMVALCDQRVDDFDRVVAVNLRGVFLGLRSFLGSARATGRGGSIVVTASTAGLAGSALGPYAATKHAVVSLVKTAAQEGAPLGVRVNAIAPGSIDTPMITTIESTLGGGEAAAAALHNTTPLGRAQGRYGRIEEVAGVVAFLLADQASWITGVTVPVDGGVLAMDPYRPELAAIGSETAVV
jgi:NAD(P)-dependent dehydrogenase (short-subunit alcohol dehydrogenase family)